MNMKKNFLTMLLALALCSSTFAQWKPAGDKIKTSWGEQLDPKNVLPEYPRPIMERNDWKKPERALEICNHSQRYSCTCHLPR